MVYIALTEYKLKPFWQPHSFTGTHLSPLRTKPSLQAQSYSGVLMGISMSSVPQVRSSLSISLYSSFSSHCWPVSRAPFQHKEDGGVGMGIKIRRSWYSFILIMANTLRQHLYIEVRQVQICIYSTSEQVVILYDYSENFTFKMITTSLKSATEIHHLPLVATLKYRTEIISLGQSVWNTWGYNMVK